VSEITLDPPYRSTPQYLVQIGDIGVTDHEVVTPYGSAPLAGSRWYVEDRTYLEPYTPTWAIVLAVVGLFVVFVLSLLFLLVKDHRVAGYLDVTVRSGSFTGMTRVPAGSHEAAQLHQKVAYAHQLAEAATAVE
jgi:hypothetical protein